MKDQEMTLVTAETLRTVKFCDTLSCQRQRSQPREPFATGGCRCPALRDRVSNLICPQDLRRQAQARLFVAGILIGRLIEDVTINLTLKKSCAIPIWVRLLQGRGRRTGCRPWQWCSGVWRRVSWTASRRLHQPTVTGRHPLREHGCLNNTLVRPADRVG
jgi:hypothetical protein